MSINDVSCQHLHNALKAIEENNIDLAYKEICIHIIYNNGKLEEHEENMLSSILFTL